MPAMTEPKLISGNANRPLAQAIARRHAVVQYQIGQIHQFLARRVTTRSLRRLCHRGNDYHLVAARSGKLGPLDGQGVAPRIGDDHHQIPRRNRLLLPQDGGKPRQLLQRRAAQGAIGGGDGGVEHGVDIAKATGTDKPLQPDHMGVPGA